MSRRARAAAIMGLLRAGGCFQDLFPSDEDDLIDCIEDALDATDPRFQAAKAYLRETNGLTYFDEEDLTGNARDLLAALDATEDLA